MKFEVGDIVRVDPDYMWAAVCTTNLYMGDVYPKDVLLVIDSSKEDVMVVSSSGLVGWVRRDSLLSM